MIYLTGPTEQFDTSTIPSWKPLNTTVSDRKYNENIIWEYLSTLYKPDIIGGSFSTVNMVNNNLVQLNTSPLDIRILQFYKISDYLLQNPNLLKILRETCLNARVEFGSESQLSLEYEENLEFTNSYLVLFIRQKIYTDDFMDRVDNFRSQYDEVINGCLGDFFITTDFQLPR